MTNMILPSTMTIIICYKEIYSWNNILLSYLVFGSIISLSSQYPKGNPTDDDIIKDISTLLSTSASPKHNTISTDSSTSLSSKVIKSESATFKPTIFHDSESSSKVVSDGMYFNNISLGLNDTNLLHTGRPREYNNSNFNVHVIPATIKSINFSIHSDLSKSDEPVTISMENYFSTSDSANTSTTVIRSSTTLVKSFNTSTNIPPIETDQQSSSHYVIITICALIIIALVAYAIYHFYRKEQVRRLRLQLMPVYNFDPAESDDWESNLLEEESTSLRQNNKGTLAAETVTTPTTSSAPLRQRSNVPVTYL